MPMTFAPKPTPSQVASGINARGGLATPPEAGSLARAARPAARLRLHLRRPGALGFGLWAVLTIACCLWPLASAKAANVRLYFQSNTNASVLDTNVLIATPISANNVLANGGVIAQGLPFRINNPSGVVTQSFNVGWFSISNRALGRGIVINVYDSSSTLYDLTNVLESGFNTYKKTVYGTNPPPTYDEITNSLGYVPLGATQGTNAWTAADTVVSNGLSARLIATNDTLYALINAATNSGITAATATNISAYQALLTSNGLSARLIATNAANLAQTVTNTGGFATNVTIRALGDPSTKAIRVFDIVGQEKFFVTDEGVYIPTITTASGVELIGVNEDGQIVKAIGNTFTNDTVANAINATNIYGAGLVTMTNVANTRSTVSSNGLSDRLFATNTLILTTLTNNLIVTSNGLSDRLLATNTLLTTRIGDATNSLAGAISNRYNNADTVVSNGLYALIASGAGGGIPTASGSGTNTTLYFNSAQWGTNNSQNSVGGAILSGNGNLIGAVGSTYNYILSGVSNSIGNGASGSVIASGFGNGLGISALNGTISGGAANSIGPSGLGNTIGGGVTNRIGSSWSGDGNTIGGGYNNNIFATLASFNYSTIPGGYSNRIFGSNSFAAGFKAAASNHNSFVWADNTGDYFGTTGTNQFLIRSAGGVAINTNDPAGNSLRVAGATATDRLALGARELIQATTNIIAVTNAGTASANGLFRNVNSTHYTNDFTGSVITNNTAGNWQIKNGVTVLYSGSTPITTTTIQSGASPAPTSAFGNYFNADGTVFRGVLSSTNLDARFTAVLGALTNFSWLTNYTTSREIYVAKNGLSANPGTYLYPKLTISNAVYAATAGDTVNIAGGTYTENNLLKANVNYNFSPGSGIFFNQTATNDPGWGVFDDRTVGPTTNIIQGFAFIEMQGCTNTLLFPEEDEIFNPNPNTRGVIVMTNEASKLTIRGGTVSGSKMSTVGGMGIFYFTDGTSDVTVTEITNRQHGLSYDVGITAFPTITTGIKTENGNHVFRVPYLSGELYAWEWRANGATTTNDVIIHSGMVKGICYGLTDVPETRGWFHADEIDGTYSAFPSVVAISCYGSGKWYWDVLKVKSQTGAPAIDTATGAVYSNVVVWVNAQKIESDNHFVNARVGEVYVTAQDWKFTGSHMAQGILNSGNGQVFPFYSIGGKTNISASASSIVLTFQKTLPSTNYTLTLNHNFNPAQAYYISSRTRTNATITYAAGVSTGGQIDYTATLQAQ